MVLKTIFGKNLKRIRSDAGITQEELAESIGLCAEFISLLERGVNAPSFETLERISLTLETEVHVFFKPDDGKDKDCRITLND